MLNNKYYIVNKINNNFEINMQLPIRNWYKNIEKF